MDDLRDDAAARTLRVSEGAAASVKLDAGGIVRCLRGSVWLTHEGDARDYVLVAGTAFHCAERGLAVVTALDGGSVLSVVTRGGPGVSANGVHIESLATIEQAARMAQAKHAGMLIGRGIAAVVRSMRSMLARAASLRARAVMRQHEKSSG